MRGDEAKAPLFDDRAVVVTAATGTDGDAYAAGGFQYGGAPAVPGDDGQCITVVGQLSF